ncbi:MAG: hypothetical protein ABII12_16365 [Planctomycetota bacterium]
MSCYNAAMPRRRPIRRILKWAGLALCTGLAALWVASWPVKLSWYDKTGTHGFWMNGGGIAVIDGNVPMRFVPRRWHVRWYWFQGRWRWWPMARTYTPPVPALGAPAVQSYYWLPLWPVFVIIAIPTAFLCWRDRRRIPPGHCEKCGYDLTGNESGKCPECGTAAPPTEGP